jgi:hypothetical protein
MNKKIVSLLLGGSLLLASHLGMAQYCNSASSSQSFIDNANGTVTDTRTGLMWKKCLEGQDHFRCFGQASLMRWEEAATRAQLASGDQFAGYADWRLPSVDELESIVDRNCEEPAANLQVFPRMPAAGLWSGNQADPVAWSMDFSKGRAFKNLKVGGKYVRLVRTSR